jgi:[acyl-carrier-protein] S-malonyltransferase
MRFAKEKLAFVFPGQGSQFVGMGRDLVERYEVARKRFEEADGALGYELSRICFEGPADELKLTRHTQPGLYVCSVCCHDLLAQQGIIPRAVAGHSLGEYSALYAAGVVDFKMGLHLVKTRGEAMAAAADARAGTMAAIIGLDQETVEVLCKQASQDGIVGVANINSPQQIVVSGEPKAVERLVRLAQEAGSKRAVLLPVHGAFHSPLMKEAGEKLRSALANAALNPPAMVFVNNADAAELRDPGAIRDSLARQVTSCVKWVDSIQYLSKLGIIHFIEVGPGKVLGGLIKRIISGANIFAAGSAEEINAIVDQWAA